MSLIRYCISVRECLSFNLVPHLPPLDQCTLCYSTATYEMVVEKAAFGRYSGYQYSVNNNGRGVIRIDTSDNSNIQKRYTEFGGVGLSLS